MNESRAFPFNEEAGPTVGALEIPDSLLVDAGFVLGIRARSDPDAPVWLYQVRRVGTTITLEFRFEREAGGGATHAFIFSFDRTAARGTAVFADAQKVTGGLPDAERGEAFIVIGDATSLATNTWTEVATTDSRILPSLVQSLLLQYVRRIHLANDLGARFLDCGSSAVPDGEDPDCPSATVMARDIQGDVKIYPGYNAQVLVSTDDNRLTLGGSVGAGLGQPCEEVSRVPATDSSSMTVGSSLPEEADSCDGLIYTIDGVVPDDEGGFYIRGGRGILVRGDQEPEGLLRLTLDETVLVGDYSG